VTDLRKNGEKESEIYKIHEQMRVELIQNPLGGDLWRQYIDLKS
jgi:hypothetical protein